MRERPLRSSSLFPLPLSARLARLASVALLACVGGAWLAPRDAGASVAVAASVEELARASSVIARVTTLDRESAWEDGRIVTHTRVRVDAVIAGATPGASRQLRVRTLGGRVGNIGQLVEGEPVLTPSESSIVFLTPRGEDLVVVGRAQGQLVVRRDVHGHEVVHVGAVGQLVERRVRAPLRPVGAGRIVELEGAPVDVVASDAKRAWEVGHAR
ncbi:MAG: hypothetical protein JWP87_4722 [Labilithrix sp.]|nr:hypothetical protein [Labilithrix sp.]